MLAVLLALRKALRKVHSSSVHARFNMDSFIQLYRATLKLDKKGSICAGHPDNHFIEMPKLVEKLVLTWPVEKQYSV